MGDFLRQLPLSLPEIDRFLRPHQELRVASEQLAP